MTCPAGRQLVTRHCVKERGSNGAFTLVTCHLPHNYVTELLHGRSSAMQVRFSRIGELPLSSDASKSHFTLDNRLGWQRSAICDRAGNSCIVTGSTTGIGNAYRSQTHKVFQTSCGWLSAAGMKTVKFKERRLNGRLLRRVGKQLSIDRVLAQFQGARSCIDQFGFCAGLTMSFLVWMSFLLRAAHSGAEKGVI